MCVGGGRGRCKGRECDGGGGGGGGGEGLIDAPTS